MGELTEDFSPSFERGDIDRLYFNEHLVKNSVFKVLRGTSDVPDAVVHSFEDENGELRLDYFEWAEFKIEDAEVEGKRKFSFNILKKSVEIVSGHPKTVFTVTGAISGVATSLLVRRYLRNS